MVSFNDDLDYQFSHRNSTRQRNIVHQFILSDLADIIDILESLIQSRYLNRRNRLTVREEYDMGKVFQLPDYTFKQAFRTSKDGSLYLLNDIRGHDVFVPKGNRPQLPIPHQLALTLERLGSCGNGASIGRFSRNLNVGRGSVVNVTRRVIEAIISLGPTYLKWPDAARRQEISWVMKQEGFEGCVGFVDGTTFPIFQRPGYDGKVFFDRKKRYSLNAQVICDCDKNIIAFITGWPGSCADSFVYQKMLLSMQPNKFFDDGQLFSSPLGLFLCTR